MTDKRPGQVRRDQARRSRLRGDRSWHVLAHVVLGIGSLVMVFPFLYELSISLMSQQEVLSIPPHLLPTTARLHNYVDAWRAIPMGHQLIVSLVTTAAIVIGQLVLCSLAGYAFARLPFPGRGLTLAVVLSVLMIPSQAYLLPQYKIVEGLGLLNSMGGIILPGLFSAFGTFLMRQAFIGLPRELEEAALLDGASRLQIFSRVMLPLVRPSLAALTILTALFGWNQLLWPLVIITDQNKMPLSVGLAALQGMRSTDYPTLMAGATIAMAPVIILFIVLQRRVIEGLAHSGLKG